MSINVDAEKDITKVILSPYQPNYSVSINGEVPSNTSTGYNNFIVDFNEAFDLGSTISVNSNGLGFSKVIQAQ